MGLAAVFAGLCVLTTVIAFVYSLFVLVVAVPFGLTSYVLWYQASGRLRDRVRRSNHRARTAGPERGGFGAGPREEWTGPRRTGPGPNTNGFGPGRGVGANGRTVRRPSGRSGLSTTEASEILGIDPDADRSHVHDAYREKAKRAHPDAESGSQREFKRVNEAYERLTNGREP